jgi:hypothetical protein
MESKTAMSRFRAGLLFNHTKLDEILRYGSSSCHPFRNCIQNVRTQNVFFIKGFCIERQVVVLEIRTLACVDRTGLCYQAETCPEKDISRVNHEMNSQRL